MARFPDRVSALADSRLRDGRAADVCDWSRELFADLQSAKTQSDQAIPRVAGSGFRPPACVLVECDGIEALHPTCTTEATRRTRIRVSAQADSRCRTIYRRCYRTERISGDLAASEVAQQSGTGVSGCSSVDIAPRRSPVRVRLAPLENTAQAGASAPRSFTGRFRRRRAGVGRSFRSSACRQSSAYRRRVTAMFEWLMSPVTAPSSARAAMIKNDASERRKSCETRSTPSSSEVVSSALRTLQYAFGFPLPNGSAPTSCRRLADRTAGVGRALDLPAPPQ
jgi:hypothetical protein